MTNEELVVYYKHSGCNCCQAVLKTLSGDSEELMKLGSGFGSGMGCMEGSCGALVGAVMAAGLCGQGRAARSILQSFKGQTGATVCAELKRLGVSCDDCVRCAVRAFGENVR